MTRKLKVRSPRTKVWNSARIEIEMEKIRNKIGALRAHIPANAEPVLLEIPNVDSISMNSWDAAHVMFTGTNQGPGK